MKKSFIADGVTYKHGDHITLKLLNIPIDDAVLCFSGSNIFICQDFWDGARGHDLMGKKYSYVISKNYLVELIEGTKTSPSVCHISLSCNKPRD